MSGRSLGGGGGGRERGGGGRGQGGGGGRGRGGGQASQSQNAVGRGNAAPPTPTVSSSTLPEFGNLSIASASPSPWQAPSTSRSYLETACSPKPSSSVPPGLPDVELGFTLSSDFAKIDKLISEIKELANKLGTDRRADGYGTEVKNLPQETALEAFKAISNEDNNVLEIDLKDQGKSGALKFVELHVVLGLYLPEILYQLRIRTRGHENAIKEFLRDQKVYDYTEERKSGLDIIVITFT